jgi:hypothetical protein
LAADYFSNDIVRLRRIGKKFDRKSSMDSAAEFFVVQFVGVGCDKKFFIQSIQRLGLLRND